MTPEELGKKVADMAGNENDVFLFYKDGESNDSLMLIKGDVTEIKKGIFSSIMSNNDKPAGASAVSILMDVIYNLMMNDADIYNSFVKLVTDVTDEIDSMDNLNNSPLN